ncbi:MAG: phosphodiester glycosidase family protein [Prosthecobacter sp.]
MSFTARILLVLLLLSLVGQAQPWRLESSSHAGSLGHGAGFVIKKLVGPAKAEMKLVIFDEKNCQMRVVANAERKSARSLQRIGHAEKALAVCNGGYFHAGGNFGPAGLEIADGRRTGTYEDQRFFGALIVRQGTGALVWDKEFQDSPDITQAVQCSPWLVSEGRVVPLTQQGPDPRNARTFILTDGEGRWAIGTCKNVGLLELAHILVTPGIISEMKVKRALNLDGGPSTGLWCRNEAGVDLFEVPGWAVRNAIVVAPRDSK